MSEIIMSMYMFKNSINMSLRYNHEKHLLLAHLPRPSIEESVPKIIPAKSSIRFKFLGHVSVLLHENPLHLATNR